MSPTQESAPGSETLQKPPGWKVSDYSPEYQVVWVGTMADAVEALQQGAAKAPTAVETQLRSLEVPRLPPHPTRLFAALWSLQQGVQMQLLLLVLCL